MTTLTQDRPAIASVSLTESDRNPQAFASELGRSFEDYGFAIIADHGIPDELIQRAEEKAKAFFALPDEVKRKYHIAGGGGARGYTPFGIETAKDSKYPDLKEFFHIGREIPDDSPYREFMDPNVWPTEVPGFRENAYSLFLALDQLGLRVLSALALHIGLAEDFFVEPTRFGNSILRPIHYPPITAPDVPNVRAGAHEDINLITLLVGASAAGLEVLSRKGEWVPFTASGDTIVVNIGDMLQRLSNHVYPSTTHRVVNPPGDAARQPRYSTPYFLHANPDYLIRTLPQCVGADNPDRYPEPITANDYLMQRLREIKLA